MYIYANNCHPVFVFCDLKLIFYRKQKTARYLIIIFSKSGLDKIEILRALIL